MKTQKPCFNCSNKRDEIERAREQRKKVLRQKIKSFPPSKIQTAMLSWGCTLSNGDTVTGSAVLKDFDEFRDGLPASVEIEELFYINEQGETIAAGKKEKKHHIGMNYEVFTKIGKGKERKELLVLLETEYKDEILRKVLRINELL
ncbi:MAG: hypothetical protein AB1423_14420 [Pseudomonadota bacterium]